MTDEQKIKTIAILGDIIEIYTVEIKAKFDMKNEMNQIAKRCKKIVKFIDKYTPEKSEIFGETSDELKQVIENHLLKL